MGLFPIVSIDAVLFFIHTRSPARRFFPYVAQTSQSIQSKVGHLSVILRSPIHILFATFIYSFTLPCQSIIQIHSGALIRVPHIKIRLTFFPIVGPYAWLCPPPSPLPPHCTLPPPHPTIALVGITTKYLTPTSPSCSRLPVTIPSSTSLPAHLQSSLASHSKYSKRVTTFIHTRAGFQGYYISQ